MNGDDADRASAALDGRAPAFPIVGVGASAGGMEAFAEIVRDLPVHPGMAFVLIQHLDPSHPSHLRDVIARATHLDVREIRDGMRVEPDRVYTLPSNADVSIHDGAFALVARDTDSPRPHLAIDFFFKALAADRGHLSIGVVLSGTGSDGTEGLRAIKASGGVTFAQDPHDAKFGAMPDAAIRAGVVDFTLPIPALVDELQRIGQHPFLTVSADQAVLASPSDASDLDRVLEILRAAVGVDLRAYKLPSIRRRLARRMAVHRLTSLPDYVRILRGDRDEARALFEDLLIHVTAFFRDPEVFTALAEHAFPELLRQKRGGGTIRVWVAGCSTGEEAYAVAIALREFLARENASEVPIQVFATDVSETAISVARAGVYTDAAVRELGAERIGRWFTRVDGGGYQISKSIRERCAFVKHDLTSDPPFSKLDLVTCRNVLIYFGPELQRRVLGMFHFALNRPGFLLLGRAEAVAEGGELFSVIDAEHKLFARNPGRSALRIAPARELPQLVSTSEPRRRVPTLENLLALAERQLLDTYAPPGVIVNDRLEIVRYRGRTGVYLEPSPGEPQHALLKMARRGLVADLRIGIAQARQERTTVRRPGVRVDEGGAAHACDIVVIPVGTPADPQEYLFAVMFEEPRAPAVAPPVAVEPTSAARDARTAKLESDLAATSAYLQSIIDERERTNDELISANEELVSSNEELQSLNEELETAKEELQSTNEELSTLNEELQSRNTEVHEINSDLINILGSVEVPIVIVDAGRRIRRFTPKARPILNLVPSDVGRPLDDIKPAIEIHDLDRKIADVIDTVSSYEEEVRGPNDRWFRLQIRPYLTLDKKIEGAVISVVDIDVLKRALGAAEWARDYAKATVEAVMTPLIVLDGNDDIVSANRAFREHLDAGSTTLGGTRLFDLHGGAWGADEIRHALASVREEESSFGGLEVALEIPGLGRRTLALSGRAIATPTLERLSLLAVEDITDRRRAEAERERLLAEAEAAKATAEAATRAKDEFLAMLSHELRTPLSTLLMQGELLMQATLDAPAIERAGQAISRAAKVQAQLIDDLLDVSRIVTGKLRMQMQPTSLTSCARDAIDLVRGSAEAKHIDLEVHLDDALPAISGDPARLQQVVWNLLTNAIKFTPPRGRVIVTVDKVGEQGRIQVRDTGVGIEPSFLPSVFQRFQQEDRLLTRTAGGLGLGLGIVRYVAEAHGGTVTAESAGRGKGSTLTVLLPLLAGHVESTGRDGAASRGAALEGVRVLVVEDDPGTREALTTMLAIAGAGVRSVASAAAAMSCFDEVHPDLLVCDIAMPDEDGYTLLGRIRALGHERGGDVPALALTALAGDEDRRRAVEAGFQEHMAKPVDINRLVRALARLRATSERRA